MNVNVNVTGRKLNIGQPNHLIVQNIGSQPVFIARSSASIAARGIRLEAGDVCVVMVTAENDYYVATASGTSSVRVLIWN